MTDCLKCGRCCQVLAVNLKGMTNELKEYLVVRGGVVNKNFLVLPHVCPMLIGNLCSIHETKPMMCKAFIGQEGYYIPKGCSYEL